MKSEITITKNMADKIFQICYDIVEFSKLYNLDHPEGAKNIFQSNENVKKGLQWFIYSNSKLEMLNNINAYAQPVTKALRLYENLNLNIENKDKIINHLKNLEIHLNHLKEELNNNI